MAKKSLPITGVDSTKEEFATMYQTHAPLIYRFMFWRTKDEMLAEDLTENVFEKAWRTRNNFTGGSAKAWLYKIARTTLIDYWRKRQDVLLDEESVQGLVSDSAPLEEQLDRDLVLDRLAQALARLPAEMHQVVSLRFIEGRSARETAARLHLTEANVRVIQYRALKKLRGYMQ